MLTGLARDSVYGMRPITVVAVHDDFRFATFFASPLPVLIYMSRRHNHVSRSLAGRSLHDVSSLPQNSLATSLVHLHLLAICMLGKDIPQRSCH
jgi:hypothetical protein